jgi:hypothetical protein
MRSLLTPCVEQSDGRHLCVRLEVSVISARAIPVARMTYCPWVVMAGNLGDEGATAIATALTRNATITSMDLGGARAQTCDATPQIARVRWRVLVFHVHVCCDASAENGIDHAGVAALANALELNAAITSLNLERECCAGAHAVALHCTRRFGVPGNIGDHYYTLRGAYSEVDRRLAMHYRVPHLRFIVRTRVMCQEGQPGQARATAASWRGCASPRPSGSSGESASCCAMMMVMRAGIRVRAPARAGSVS